LDRKEKEKNEREPGLAGRFITITFLGYYDRKGGGGPAFLLAVFRIRNDKCWILILEIKIKNFGSGSFYE